MSLVEVVGVTSTKITISITNADIALMNEMACSVTYFANSTYA